MESIAKHLNSISPKWVIDDILDIKTCETKTDDYSQHRIGMMVNPVVLGIGGNAMLQYRYSDESDDRDTYRASCMFTTNVDEIHVSLNEDEKCVVMSIFTENSIYILRANVDISGMNVAHIDYAIEKINKELEEKE